MTMVSFYTIPSILLLKGPGRDLGMDLARHCDRWAVAHLELDIRPRPNGPGRPAGTSQNRTGEKDFLSTRLVYRKLGTS